MNYYVFHSYILILLCYQKIASLSQMSRFMGTLSHDRLTDLLDATWNNQKRLFSCIKHCHSLWGGYLIIDDTVIQKKHAKELTGFGWLYDHSQHKAVYGIAVVLLLWTDGKRRVPLGYRIYTKGGKTRIQLALELLSVARNHWRIPQLQGVLFDCWYSSKSILKRINDYGWCYYTQVKRNRSFKGKQLKHYQRGAYWHERGYLTGNLKVLLIRNHKKYFITNRLNQERIDVITIYHFRRQEIEECFKILKGQLCLCFLRDRKISHWEHHICLECLAFIVLESFSFKNKVTPYRMKEEFISRRPYLDKELWNFITKNA